MTVYIDLEENTPESIFSLLMAQCEQAAKSGIIHEEPVYVEFKNQVWIVTYINSVGEFAESFKSRGEAMKFMDGLLEYGMAHEVKIRGAEK